MISPAPPSAEALGVLLAEKLGDAEAQPLPLLDAAGDRVPLPLAHADPLPLGDAEFEPEGEPLCEAVLVGEPELLSLR